MLSTGMAGNRSERTWRPPLTLRIAQAACLGLLLVLPGALLAVTLVTNRVPDGGWIALALAVAAWGLLAWRFLLISVTLSPDTLVIRNVLATVQVPLADVTGLGFRRGLLTVTSSNGGAAYPRLRVRARAVYLGASYWSGLRCRADAIAEAISEAAGHPPLPPRRQIISRSWAWFMILAGALIFGVGLYYGPLQIGPGGATFGLRELGSLLYVGGAAMLGFAFRLIRDYRRYRTDQGRLLV